MVLVSIIILLNPGQALINTIAANMVLIAFAILTILLGVEEQEPTLFNIGIAIFVLFIITRYIDIFWKLQEKSMFFIISGIVLLFGGMYLEKKRRQIVERMKASE